MVAKHCLHNLTQCQNMRELARGQSVKPITIISDLVKFLQIIAVA